MQISNIVWMLVRIEKVKCERIFFFFFRVEM
jgi:hypothetical protein